MRQLAVYCESFGCQMNAYDSEVIASLLEGNGHRMIDSPADADVIILNTCSVRAHAENRAIGRLHDLSRHRRAALVVCGCMAQRLGERLFDIVPPLRGVAGPSTYDRLSAAVAESVETGGRFSLLEADAGATYAFGGEPPRGGASRYLAITMGCDNYCSYCVVPYLRGTVRSKEADTILREAGALAAAGAREITLLGQNVIAYRSGAVDFLALVGRLLRETTVARLRFMTSHPKDMSERIFEAMSEDSRLCPHIHLPVQAGSDRVLRLMNRGYTSGDYLAMIQRGRSLVPGLAVTTDIIVGFPSEGEDDFRMTLDLVREARFDAAFTFKYSPREGTAAASMPDDVPSETKRERLRVLNDAVAETRTDILRSQLGSKTEILLDGAVKKGEHRFLKGRTPHFRNVVVAAEERTREGEIVPVTLRRLVQFTFEADVRGPCDAEGGA